LSFTKEDLTQIENKGINAEKVEEQIMIFRRGNLPVNIESAATPGNGIHQLTDKDQAELENYYDTSKDALDIIKFVPASGAASRMFKDLHYFLSDFDPGRSSIDDYLSKSKNEGLRNFFGQMEDLPFYETAVNYAREGQPGFDNLNEEAQKYVLLQTMLFSPGLDLSNYPKGLVPFHNYGDHVATAFEEHLFEAAEYASSQNTAKLHFTVADEHIEKFKAELDKIRARVEGQTGIKFEISFSFQDPATDTIAVDANNNPFRTDDGKLFFRPGGHGALIRNLNAIDADVIFIKNIDNVVILQKASELAKYKKLLAGKLLKLQKKSFHYLTLLDNKMPDEELLTEIRKFIKDDLNVDIETQIEDISLEKRILKLRDRLNRPLRVCGMVKNEGEPGGGPFLVNMEDGTKSLQIIEGAQIDQNNSQQKEIAQNATHFNPVDIVAGNRNYKGEKFDLLKFIDPATSFIAEKSESGRPLKALELPGLWNGAMAYWNTMFVEVPVSTFNPVKTVADLIKSSHQSVK